MTVVAMHTTAFMIYNLKRQAISTEGIFRSYLSSTYELKTPKSLLCPKLEGRAHFR